MKTQSKVQYNEKGEKLCTKCNSFKDTINFHKWSKGKDGLKLFCKQCVREYDMVEADPKRVFPRKINKDGNIHCRNCGEYFPENEMYLSRKNSKYKSISYCLECRPLLDRTRMILKYGITLDQYHELLEKQDYRCKICNKKDTTFRSRLSIDHDHNCCPGNSNSCGKCIRGLLCHNCNITLGNARDDIKILQSMVDYLKSGYIKF